MSLKFRLSAYLFGQLAVLATTLINVGTYLLGTLHLSGTEVGLIYATNALAACVSPPLLGYVADRRVPTERLLGGLHLVSGLALLGCYSAGGFADFYGWMLLFNLAFVPTFGLAAGMCFHHLGDPAREYPRLRVWGTVSFMLVSLGLTVFSLETSPRVLLAGAGGSLLLAGFTRWLPPTPPQTGFRWADLRGQDVRRLLGDRRIQLLFGALFLACVPTTFYYSFLNPFLNEVGWTAVGARMSLGQLFEIGFVLAMPWVFRRFTFRAVITGGLLAWGLRYLAFAVARPGHWEWLLYPAILVQGMAFAWLVIAGQVFVDRRVPPGLRNTAQGIVVFVELGLGAFLGSWLAGAVVEANVLGGGGHNWWAIWLVPGLVGTGTAALFWWLFPRDGTRLA